MGTNRQSAIHRLLFAAICLAPLSSAYAQPGPTPVYASYDWQVERADLVVLGNILKVRTEGSDGNGTHFATLRVRETLLGEKHKELSFVIAPTTRERIRPWQEQMDELLVVLVDTRDKDKRSLPPMETELQPQQLPGDRWCVFSMNPDAKCPPVADASLNLLHTPKELLQATRKNTANRRREESTSHKVVTSDLGDRFRGAGILGTFHYIVPVNSSLEANARIWIGSDSFGLREEGAKALVYFKSDENIARLKPLLKDPANWVLPEYPAEGGYRTCDFYPVRAAAWKTLTKWNVKVEKPVIKVPRPEE